MATDETVKNRSRGDYTAADYLRVTSLIYSPTKSETFNQSSLTVWTQEGDDHSPRIGQKFTILHFSSSILRLGKVNLQLVEQILNVHFGQVGDQNALRTHLRLDLQDDEHTNVTHRTMNTDTDETHEENSPPPAWGASHEPAGPPP